MEVVAARVFPALGPEPCQRRAEREQQRPALDLLFDWQASPSSRTAKRTDLPETIAGLGAKADVRPIAAALPALDARAMKCRDMSCEHICNAGKIESRLLIRFGMLGRFVGPARRDEARGFFSQGRRVDDLRRQSLPLASPLKGTSIHSTDNAAGPRCLA